MVDLRPHKAGIEAARDKHVHICSDPRSAFMGILSAEGFNTPKTLKIGSIDRLDGAEDRRGNRSAWYVYNEIDDIQNDGAIIGVANYGDWKSGVSESWTSRSEHKMNMSERAAYHAAREIMRAQHDEEERARQIEAAKLAYTIWSASPNASSHPYLQEKGVGSCTGLKIAKDSRLIVPIAVNKEITSLQFINDDGEKRFLTGGKLKGGWFVIEGNNDTVYIAEGYSTGKSINEATGNTVYIAFNAGNIYEVATFVKSEHPNSRLIIAGDDDFKTDKNVGRAKATQAAEGLQMEVIFPSGFVDFNDMHKDLGLDALSSYLRSDSAKPYKKPKQNIEGTLDGRPEGVVGNIYDYYNVTSGNDQKGFAIQTALACCSLILGRSYKTNYNNYPSLFFLNVGETATGKEHAKSVFEKIMSKTNNSMYMAGDGYTSSGAVMSTLLRLPKHGTCTDELGRYLEAAMSNNGGNVNQREANTMLMECFGRCDGVVRAKNYSSMTLKKADADNLANRVVHNPAITWLAMTTPSTLFETIDISSVKDGFINRFVISISEAEPTVRRHKEPVSVPDVIIEWARAIEDRCKKTHIAGEESDAISIHFSQDADDEQIKFQEELLTTRKQLRRYSMDGLVGRANEEAMRLALIYALSKDPSATIVDHDSMLWAINYMRKSLNDTIGKLKMTISHSEHESDKKEILVDLRERGEEGITRSDMRKTPPYSKYKSRELTEIMEALKEANLVADETHQNPNGGRPTVKWIAIE